jgi:hypothetical protein
VTISGAVTFDEIGHVIGSNVSTTVAGARLDYNNTTQAPARSVVVQAVDGSGTVLDTDTTDASGNYSVSVDPSTPVRIRVRSQMQQTSGATWNFQVLDNTNGNAIYLLEGALSDSGTANSTRNLNAGSGWDATAPNSADATIQGEYTGTRAAGPFAILDGLYEAVTDIAAVDATVAFPELQVFWSINNRPSNTVDDAAGDIGTSSYTTVGGTPTIRILGAANNDTDEYDTHVVVHEFGHYFEDQLSRSDSPGGQHGISDRLDPRVSFGEGWGNAFSGMILGSPVYRDVSGDAQGVGFAFSVEVDLTSAGGRVPGWYNEASVQQILYDIFDSSDDGADTISAGLAPIYAAFRDSSYINNVNFTTIFQFANRVRNEAAVNVTALDNLLAAEDVNSTDPRGVGETNNGGLAQALPIYKVATQGGGAVTVCSTAEANGTPIDEDSVRNKFGVREYITVTLNSTGAVTMTATETSGPAGTTDPDFRIWETGRLFTRDSLGQSRLAESSDDGSEVWTGTLNAGTYAIEIYDFNNFDETTAANSCFSFTVT